MSITADVLKKFYAFSAIPVSGGSYLTDTDQGRSFLLDMAVDLYNSINEQNQLGLPDDDAIYDDYVAYLLSELSINFDDYYDNYIQNVRHLFHLSNDDIKELSVDKLLSNMKELCLFLDQDILKRISGRGDNDFKDFATNAFHDVIDDLSSSSYLNNKNYIISILDGIFSELRGLYSSLCNEFFYNDAVSQYPFDQFYSECISESQLHIDIDNFLSKFRDIILSAHQSDDINDYRNVVVYIDQIIQMSHHGGPLLEYALYHTPSSMRDALGVLHAKSSPFFLEWVKSDGLLPSDAIDAIEKSRVISDYNYSDDYYKDLMYLDREQWERENLPYDQWLSRGKSSSQLGYMNAAEVWDMSQRLLKKRQDAEQSGVSVDIDDLIRLREMEDWSRDYLGHKLPSFRFSSTLSKISSKIDNIASDISDSLDLVLLNQVGIK